MALYDYARLEREWIRQRQEREAAMREWWTPERVENMRKLLTGLVERGDELGQSWMQRHLPHVQAVGWYQFLVDESTDNLFSWREVCRRAEMVQHCPLVPHP